MGKKLISI